MQRNVLVGLSKASCVSGHTAMSDDKTNCDGISNEGRSLRAI